MHCPACHHADHFVTRTEERETVIRRTRQCRECGKRWVTTEAPAEVYERAEKVLDLAGQLQDLREAA